LKGMLILFSMLLVFCSMQRINFPYSKRRKKKKIFLP
jgi:hypothetical protein